MLSTKPKKLVVFLSGATAVGKTQNVLDLSEQLNIRIISVDAAQVFRGMDVGTAKLEREICQRYPHYLIDIRDPWQYYSAADFCKDAYIQINKAHAEGNIPVLTGGTMFYFSALLKGLSSLPSADSATRLGIQQRGDQVGADAMHKELCLIDPPLAEKLHVNDRQRVQRALEIYQITKRQPSIVMQECAPVPCPWPVLHISLFHPDRKVLHERISRRFDIMLQKGLIAEVENLRADSRILRQSIAMKTVGYRQVWNFLEGDIDHNGLRDTTVAATRQLAKRQLTWLRHTAGVVWMQADRSDTTLCISNYIKEFTRTLSI